MTVEEYSLIQVSKSNKDKLDSYKLVKKESYNDVLDELIKLGEKNNFKNIRIKNLTKNLEEEDENNKQGAVISDST